VEPKNDKCECVVCGEMIARGDGYYDSLTGTYSHVFCKQIIDFIESNPSLVEEILDNVKRGAKK